MVLSSESYNILSDQLLMLSSRTELRDFIENNDMSDPSIRGSVTITARVLWSRLDQVKKMHFLRLFLGEIEAKEPLEEQQEVRHCLHPSTSSNTLQQEFQKAQKRDAMEANQFLITLSLYEVYPQDQHVPPPGTIITFTANKFRLYMNCCQLDTTLDNIEQRAP